MRKEKPLKKWRKNGSFRPEKKVHVVVVEPIGVLYKREVKSNLEAVKYC